MSLKHAILGFLNYQPQTGYELKAVFDTSVRHFWSADQAQIYRTLGDLEANGLVTVEVIPQDNRPNKKVYHITDAGRAELRHWLLKPEPQPETRSAPVIQLFFAGQLADEEILALLEGMADEYRARVALLEQLPTQMNAYEETETMPRAAYFWRLTLELGTHTARENLRWLENVIERIRNHEHPAS